MKKINVIIANLILSFFAVLISCKEDDSGSGTDSEIEAAAAILTSNEWSPADANSIELDGTPVSGWDAFSLAFSGNENGGTYSASNVPEGYENVWPGEGTWEFASINGTVSVNTIVRTNDGVEMNAIIGNGSLDLSFGFQVENGRVGSIIGDWTFGLQ